MSGCERHWTLCEGAKVPGLACVDGLVLCSACLHVFPEKWQGEPTGHERLDLMACILAGEYDPDPRRVVDGIDYGHASGLPTPVTNDLWIHRCET